MKRTTAKLLLAFTAGLMVSSPATADAVFVDIYGHVVFNQITGPGLGQVQTGEDVHISFEVSSDSFVVSIPGDINSYFMFPGLFSMDFSGGQTAGFSGPAFFSVVDGFPVSDGFFVSSSIVSPGGIALTQAPYQLNFSVGYVGSTLGSTNILDALGTYDFTGLTNFGFNIWAFSPDNVQMEIDFEYMTISAVPGPATLLAFMPLALAARRRRRE